jgi:transcriptional regulator NrdR
MHCPFCQHEDTRVIDSRVSEDGATIRRRRECEACGERFNTFETAEIKLPNVVKGDGRREPFDEGTLRAGFMRALQKRPVGSEQVDAAVRVVVEELRRSGEREVPSLRIGTPAVTTRGYREPECVALAEWMCDVLDSPNDERVIAGVRDNVVLQCRNFPVYG